jgi:hypothetical protein
MHQRQRNKMIKKFNNFNEDVAADVNNLTGIIDTKIDWFGEDPANRSKNYEDFKSPKWSVRATFVNLYAYATKYNLYDTKSIISRWSIGKNKKLSIVEEKDLTTYLTNIKSLANVDSNTVLKYDDDKFVSEKSNIVNLFKLVQGIIMNETGKLDQDDLDGFKTVKELVVASFEIETKAADSLPAYKKYKVDLENDEYKSAVKEYTGQEDVVANKDEKEEVKKDKKTDGSVLKKTMQYFK